MSSTLTVSITPSKKICFISINKNPLKMMKNAFYFVLKAPFVFKVFFSRYFKFLSWLFGYVEKTAQSQRQGYFKIYDVTTWLTNNYDAILSNISRSKGNFTTKFGQLRELNNKNIFLHKSCQKCGRKTSFRPLFVFQKIFVWGKSN